MFDIKRKHLRSPPPHTPTRSSRLHPRVVSRRTGHCKNLKSDWEKSASALKGVVGVAAVDATESKALASEYGVQVRQSVVPCGYTAVRGWS